MSAFTCECIIPCAYRDLFDLSNADSLNAFHLWIEKRILGELMMKYGRRGLDVICQQEIWQDDLGLISDCDFQHLGDDSLRVKFSREPYTERAGLNGAPRDSRD